MKFDPNHRWDGTRNARRKLKALERLGAEKGYVLVGCNLTGANVFFVHPDLDTSKFLAPFTSEMHYQPPRYYLRWFSGHRLDPREVESFPL